MKNDLISREALKNDLIKTFPDKILDAITTKTMFYQVLQVINNLPTVMPCENCDLYFMAKTKEEMQKGGAE